MFAIGFTVGETEPQNLGMNAVQYCMARAALNWTLRQIGDNTGVSHEILRRFQQGRSISEVDTNKIRQALKLPASSSSRTTARGPAQG